MGIFVEKSLNRSVNQKTDLRKKFKVSFNEWAGSSHDVSAKLIVEQEKIIKHLEKFLNYSQVCFYSAIWGEPDLYPLFKTISQTTWCLPRVVGDQLEFRAIKQNSILVEGMFGIKEPDVGTTTQVELNEIKLFLVPGVAFDMLGVRLGRGKGYYDKMLKNFKGTKVGVAFSCQMSEHPLPYESHDVGMDFLVTPDGVRKVSR